MQNNMETLQKQISASGEIASTCSPEVSPASRSLSRANARVRKTPATFGPRCSVSFGLFDRDGSLGKTFTALLIGRTDWYSTLCALTWRRQDTKSGRTLYRLAVSALPTGGIESGLLPTVQTQGPKINVAGQSRPLPIGMLPKPTAIDGGSGRINRSLSPNAKERPSLALAARRGLLLTPIASDGLRAQFTMAALKRHDKPRAEQSNMAEQIAHITGGGDSRLNPRFVAEMMGFPSDWTELPFRRGAGSPSKPSAMR